MSLINNMLKDLERRGNLERRHPKLLLMTTQVKNNLFTTRIKIFLYSFLATFFFALIISLVMNNPSSIKMLPMAANQYKAGAELPDNHAPIATTANITAVSMQLKDNMTELSFLLDHAALYRVNSNEIQNQITFIVENSQFTSELPAINGLNTGIEHLDAKVIKGNTYFTITLSPGASIKYVNTNETEKNSEIVIALSQPVAETPLNNLQPVTSKNIKTPAMQTLLLEEYQKALSAAETDQQPLAINKLNALLKIDPYYHDARASLAALLIAQGDAIKAKQLLEDGLRLNPDYLPFVELKARILINEGKTKTALLVLQSVSPSMQENPDYHAFVAALYQRNNDDLLAMTIYKQLVAMNAQNGNWWFGLAVSLDKIGKTKEALQAYTRAMSEGKLPPETLAFLQKRLPELEGADHEKG